MERIDKINYYLEIADTVLKRGTCLRRNYGAAIVKNDEIISTGYTGAPRGRKNCFDLDFCARQKLNIKSGEKYELCRSVHAEQNAIISAARKDIIGATLYMVGRDAQTGELLDYIDSCSMCKRVVINAGIEKVIVKDKNSTCGYKVINVQDWIDYDEVLEEKNKKDNGGIKMALNIVLVEPEIAVNAGNIARTCAAIGATLHMIKPFGFDTSDAAVKKNMKRAGLDYWDKVKIIEYENLEEFKEKTKGCKMYLLSTKSKKCYTDVEYEDEAYLVFGPETRGLPEDFILDNFENAARIPMRDIIRSLNLSNAVAIVAYEAERQLRYKNLLEQSPYFDEKLK